MRLTRKSTLVSVNKGHNIQIITTMKITSYFFDELTEEQRIKVITQAEEKVVNIDYLEDCTPALGNAEIVVDEDFLLYDVKIFDPYHTVQSEGNIPLYINVDGWSNWLLEYRDNAGHDVETILRDYDGELQDKRHENESRK